ncbi:hypothetical protein JOC37_000925 [Desulfohalotomaculum tongense]|uniref:hypothetical protein n=1 Tax=Desulforadius tongensis TaxID=1216062 RepID=UPI00195CEBE9|nr:hypothetical protein [Desulforadius tongensis]MBM7854552.1 hypothetical protein [Desulforadius tongensis]
MFNPLYTRTYLNKKTAGRLEGRIIYNHVLILPDGREILIDSYHPGEGGWGLLQYPFQKIDFKSISELLKKY